MYQIFVDVGTLAAQGKHPSKEEQAQATYWLIRAGENNNWRAAEVLKQCYEIGCFGVPIDLEKSKHYKVVLEKYGPNKSVERDASPRSGSRPSP